MKHERRDTNLHSLQAHVNDVESVRGWRDDTIKDKCLILSEEVGELLQALRRSGHTAAFDALAKPSSVQDELADVLFVLLAIANRLHVDLYDALDAKLADDSKRRWVPPHAL